MLRSALLAALLAGAIGCNGKTAQAPVQPGPGDAGATVAPKGDPAECDALAEQVEGMYREQLTEPIEGEVDDAASMILADCRRQPARYAPCVRAAKTIVELERDCVIPLDKAGSVEGAMFGAASR